ncbi:substrate-binding periplasmic protein [Kiloniella sp. b19]|uniref:substrate-binding periplasmic protein n=1 Tax=Kiloniella sp. GXU_MW_B19 TaxID=3141326 RepID=UPI0031E36196
MRLLSQSLPFFLQWTGNSQFRKLIAAAILLSGSLWPCLPAHAREPADVLVIGVDESPPFAGKDLLQNGYSTHLLTTALDRLGYAYKIRFAPWERVLTEGRNGTIHLVSDIWRTPERDKHFVFSAPILHNKLKIISRAGLTPAPASPDHLQGLRVGLVQGFEYPDKLLDDPGIQKEFAPNDTANLQKLVNGRIDVTIIDESVARFILRRLAVREDRFFIPDRSISMTPMHMALSRKAPGSPELMKEIDCELAKMSGDGTVMALKTQHSLSFVTDELDRATDSRTSAQCAPRND